MNRIEKLAEAEALIREVRGSLNRKSTACPCCERMTHENWEEYQMYERLSAAMKRCRTISEWLTRIGAEVA